MVRLIKKTIGTKKLTRISRPRRFGKSYAARMLCAYYDKTCDSAELFADCEKTGDSDYGKHLGKYDVIYLDMANILGKTEPENLVNETADKVSSEVKRAYPEVL